ncbi:DNA/RNA polymerase [Terfezia boudieri ATCC MYA-4762]|uniref:DNA-directed RNA polymerase n=1 Tax=Terfezia boudieri ATCC MYA-4762 TaxID=1051890 RepID=A0A3N4LS18_9PEZI|nr:DNA/RNA polymerase [Terfezia boudieri ATCC MYA-4762]
MLTRATTKRIPRDIPRGRIRPSSAPYTEYLPSLPWRYVSTRGNSQSRCSSASSSVLPLPLRRTLDKVSEASSRNFGTNAAVMPEPAYDEGISYYGTEPISSPRGHNGIKLNPDFVILDTPDRPAVPTAHNGVSTLVNPADILSHYFVCIQAGQLARAQLVLQQLHKTLDRDARELTICHNAFLNGLFEKAQENKEHIRAFFMWYEERMKGKYQVAPDAETVALLLKASLLVPSESIGQVYLKNYVNLATRSDIPINEVFSRPIFTPEEVKYIAKSTGVKMDQLSEEQRTILTSNIKVTRPVVLDVPELISTAVKGHGLAAIKQSLRSLIDPDYIPGLTSEPVKPIDRQKLLEEDAVQSSLDRWKKDWEQRQAAGILSADKNLNVLLYEWHTAFVPLIRQELGRVAEAEKSPDRLGNGDRCLYGPFMRLLPPETLSVITMLEIIKICNDGSVIADGVKSSKAVMSVGNIIENEVLAAEIVKQTKKSETLNEALSTPSNFRMFVRRERHRSERGQKPSYYNIRPEWPTVVKAKLGAMLISMLIHCAKVRVPPRRSTDQTGSLEGAQQDVKESIQPALLHNYQYVRGRKLGIIKLHSEIAKKLSSEPLRMSVLSRHLPMVVHPRPWTGARDGGYYYSPVTAVRTKDSREQDLYVKAAAVRGDLEQLFLGLDVLGSTSWAINEKIFNVVLKVWNSGEAVADIPPRELEIVFPPEPDPSKGPLARINWAKEMRLKVAEKRNHHSSRCDVNFKLEIARAFLKEKMYFPHNVDFRGRSYPIPPHLNHIGNDLCRGLLMFHDERKLGERGLRWLKIHLSNVYGFDKASFEERAKFTDCHIDDIRDSVKDPLKGKRWWLNAEDPWQCLAACYAVKEAMDLSDPTEYMCRLPVAQDGTCNGLQHYAALGGDGVGARQVNLEPSDRPQDVYSGVAELVKAKLEADVVEGIEMAKRLLPLITRKVVKQTVMTNVYGVTFMGAKAQIYNQLKLLKELEGREDIHKHAFYLTKKVFECVRSMFTGAHHIQDWLGKSAWRISRSMSPTQMAKYAAMESEPVRSEPRKQKAIPLAAATKDQRLFYMTSVVWTTPLGLPVVQPYRRKANQLVPTFLQNVFITDPNIIDEVNSRKQMTAFPPNYIHSLDATHMLLSAIECNKAGLTFAAVHDSFWTHPSDVDTLNRVLRDAFITLHSSDLITKLYEEFVSRYAGFKYLASFPETSKVGARIKIFRLKQSIGKRRGVNASEELMIEMERDRLLRSSDPIEQEKGRDMVTAASIAESALPEDMEAGSAGEDEERLLADITGTKNIDEFVSDEMTEPQNAPNAQPQVVMLGSEDEVPDSMSGVEFAEDGMLNALDEDEAMEAADVAGPFDENGKKKAKMAKKTNGENGTEGKGGKGSPESIVTLGSEDEDPDAVSDVALEEMLKAWDEDEALEAGEVADFFDENGKKKAKRAKKANGENGKKGKGVRGRPQSKALRPNMKVNVWMQLQFPPVPAKGDFDVARLENSKYFFS